MLREIYLIVTGKIKSKRWERHLFIKKQVSTLVKKKALKNQQSTIKENFIKWAKIACNQTPSANLIDLYTAFVYFIYDNSSSKNEHRNFQIQISNLNPHPEDFKILHELYRVALSYGLFEIGYEFRKKGAEACLQLSNEYLVDKLIFLIEQGNFIEASDLIKKANNTQLNSEQKFLVNWFVEIFTSTRDVSFKKFFKPDDLRFEPYIKNKDLAIVGPMVSDIKQGEEIDSFNEVLRFNHKGEIKEYNSEIYGSKTTLSYYSICHAKALSQENYLPRLQELKFASFVKRKAHSFFKKDPIKSRQSYSFTWLLKDTEFNIGPNAVFDLLRFNPRTIKIFNTNLMLTAGRNKNYWPTSVGNTTDIEYFIKNHDPVTQFKYFSHAYKAGLITGDKQFCEVMNMGLDKYLKALQESHGFSRFSE